MREIPKSHLALELLSSMEEAYWMETDVYVFPLNYRVLVRGV